MRLLIFKITLVLIACFMAVTLYFDNRLAERSTELTALKTLEDSAHLLLTLRQVYRERIQQASLPITEDSIRLCPGSVIGEMAKVNMALTAMLVRLVALKDSCNSGVKL